MIAAFVIWSVVALVFIVIGISCCRSEKPVGFFTFQEPIQVRDTVGYNRAVARLWFVAAAILELLGVPLLFVRQNSPVILLIIPGTMFLVIGMAIAYWRITEKFKQ